MELLNSKETESNAAALLSAMANKKRLKILCLLMEGEMAVGEIGKHIDLGQSPLSQHLAKLRAHGLVQTRRVGQSIYYSLACPNVVEVLKTLNRIFSNPADAK